MFHVSGLAWKEPGEVWVQTGCCTECQGCVKYYLQETTILSSGQVWICGFHRSRDCGASLQARRCCGAESVWGADSGLIVANMSFFWRNIWKDDFASIICETVASGACEEDGWSAGSVLPQLNLEVCRLLRPVGQELNVAKICPKSFYIYIQVGGFGL